MKRSQVICFLVMVAGLVALNHFVMNPNPNLLIPNSADLVNHEHVSSQKLFENVWTTVKNNYYDESLNHQTWYRWKEHYRGKIKTDEDAKVAIDSMLASLDDPYSRYMDKSEYNEQNSSIDSKITGIGVNIASISGKIQIINVMDGTPAQASNLQNGDIILDINGKDVNGLSLSDVANLVRGPENTVVNITIMRDKDKFLKKVMRKEIKIKTVKSSVDKNIGYIQISSFLGTSTPNEFIEAIDRTKDTEGLILDLRGNTGGLLPNAVFIANLFITKGNLVSIVGRDNYRFDIEAENIELEIDKPLIVLVDGSSASASEILSGALKDYKRAKLLGTKTFGKGMVQKIVPLPNETGLNLTIAKYLTPNGADINKKGITPDIEVKLTLEDIKNRNDVQLETAKKILAEMIQQEHETAYGKVD
ncbi:S41 family peptidase [bacterium]|nr:S41 family peptidase [bacterium]